MITITRKQYYSYANRIVNKNLKEFGRSKSACSITSMSNCILCCNLDNDTLDVKDNWRELMKQASVTERKPL